MFFQGPFKSIPTKQFASFPLLYELVAAYLGSMMTPVHCKAH